MSFVCVDLLITRPPSLRGSLSGELAKFAPWKMHCAVVLLITKGMSRKGRLPHTLAQNFVVEIGRENFLLYSGPVHTSKRKLTKTQGNPTAFSVKNVKKNCCGCFVNLIEAELFF